MNDMILLLFTTATALFCEAFLPTSSFITPYSKYSSGSSTTLLNGIQEWRDQALESKYTLDCYTEEPNASPLSSASATVPILPFPFYDILLQGERKQLNLYEERFHKLFGDSRENHCGMIGMGLLTGSGMMTTLPLCEVESFTRFGADENWRDKGDGMGNGSILVTIRAMGRCRIAESELLQEEPYMKAHVVEILDEDVTMEGKEGETYGVGLKEKSKSNVRGESSPIEIASLVAENIEKLILSLASMESRLKESEAENTSLTSPGDSMASPGKAGANNEADGDKVMSRSLVNAQLESLFMTDSSEGLDMDNAEEEGGDIKEEDENEEDEHESMDRVATFQQASASAKEVDTFGYITQTTNVNDDNPSQQAGSKQQSKPIRTLKDLTATSWAAFIGEKDDMQRNILKMQALDFTNMLQRLQLGAAILQEEEKKLRAKLALAGIQESGSEEKTP